jgi:4,5-DOPA dioxygenase extradiol
MNTHLPTLFVPHGAPTFALRPGRAGEAIATATKTLAQPRVVVIASAHWNTRVPTVGFAERPETIHDFHGFPEALYRLRYPATGCREAAEEVVAALGAGGFTVERDTGRGLDHGAWIALRMMFPEADVPVVPVSIQPHAGPEHAWRVGRSLASLVGRGFLVVGSGNLTHNLGDFRAADTATTEVPAYVRRFADWFADRLAAGEHATLLDYRRQAPDAVRAHPTEEHLLPLFVALGAAGDAPRAHRIHSGVADHVLAMDAYAFEPRGVVQ